jgi:aminodeoxyfutalosine synthase
MIITVLAKVSSTRLCAIFAVAHALRIKKMDTKELLQSAPTELRSIAEKVVERQRLSPEDGLCLYYTPHLPYLQKLADFDRKQRVGDTVLYASTLYIYPTNLCELSCPMCSFYAKPGQPKAWFLTPEMVEERVRQALIDDLSEVHIVSGLCRDCTEDYYKEVFQRIRSLHSTLPIKALTAVEHTYLARLSNISLEECLKRLISWGLTSIPGGGAEILDDTLRKKIAPGKGTTAEFLEVHRTAHRLGIPSNITMLFDHIETPEHIISHLDVVRRFQDESGGIDTFVPLKYQPANNALARSVANTPRKDCHRVYAVSRLMLDNVHNIKVLWNYLGLEGAKELLMWGGNDLGSVTKEERVAIMAGGSTLHMTDSLLEQSIKDLGKIPVKVGDPYARRCHSVQ